MQSSFNGDTAACAPLTGEGGGGVEGAPVGSPDGIFGSCWHTLTLDILVVSEAEAPPFPVIFRAQCTGTQVCKDTASKFGSDI